MTGALKVRTSTSPDVWTTIGGGSFATAAETIAGTVDTKAVTPAGLDAAVYDTEPINAARSGFTRAAVIAALDAAEARGKGTIVYFPAGTYELDTGLPLSGRTCQLRGDGAGGTTAAPAGTIFKASTQSGPVLDFTGWQQPQNFQGRTIHGGFHVIGSGVADATKANAGIRLASISSVTFADISIRNTGGPCLEGVSSPGNAVYLCDFERITLNTPVSAKTNDVAWMTMNEPNGTRFRSFGLRSVLSSADVGASGAVIITGNASFSPHDILLDGWWIENLHVPTNGTVFHLASNTTILSNFQWFDTSKEAGATGTSCIRFVPPTLNDYGGNLVTGVVPGRDPGVATSIDTGIDMRQNRNSVRGVKGYKGANVTIAAGITDIDIELGGAMAAATDPAVIDSSGSNTQHYNDNYLRTETVGPWLRDTGTLNRNGPRFIDRVTPTEGAVHLGTGGVRMVTTGTGLFTNSDAINLRNLAATGSTKLYFGTTATSPYIYAAAGTPEGVLAAPIGSLYLRTDGAANTTLYIKQTGTGNTGWTAVTP